MSFELRAVARGPLDEALTIQQLEPWEITLEVDEDPGLPNVAVVTGPRTTADYKFASDNVTRLGNPDFTAQIAVSWVPTCVQTRDYNVHLTARNVVGFVTKRFHLSVVAPSPELVGFDATPQISRIGCPVNLTAVAREGSDLIRERGYLAYGQVVTHSLSRTDLRGRTQPLPELYGLHFREVRGGNEWGGSTGVVTWRPERGQDGATYTICFHMQDECRTAAVVTRCIAVDVVKCQRCLVAGESLTSIAKEYQTDFLSLYTFNVAMQTPDSLPEGELINLGLRYRVRDQDSLYSLSQRFFLSASAIIAINPDLERDVLGQGEEMQEGDALCLLPPLCSVHCPHGDCVLHPSYHPD